MGDTAELFIKGGYQLAEGPFWHRERQALFWFDILANSLFAADATGTVLDSWAFDTPVAAGAVIDEHNIAVAASGTLWRLDLETGERVSLAELEADKPQNRPNDSRVDRRGGFWLGTMGRHAEKGSGAVYRYHRGEMIQLMERVSIPNSICFAPDGTRAYFADTPTGLIMSAPTDPFTGLPIGDWTVFYDCTDQRGSPDGAVVDAEGYVWSARWGGSCVVRHAPDGRVDRVVEVPTQKVTCPAFGGPGLRTLFVTTAREGMSEEDLAADPLAGALFALDVDTPGLPETPLAI